MSFLDNLLTLAAPLEQGQQLITFPRTWRNYLPWNNQPFCYKAHQTKAGLYVVLPHDHDGSLFLKHPKKEFVQDPQSPSECLLDNIFFLQETFTKSPKLSSKQKGNKQSEELILGSTISRHNFSSQPYATSTISISYGVTAKAVPTFLRISYELVSDKYFFTKAQFNVYKNLANGRAYAVGPQVTTNIAPFHKMQLVNYDTTLENFVELVSDPDFSLDQFFSLLNFDYLEQHVLH